MKRWKLPLTLIAMMISIILTGCNLLVSDDPEPPVYIPPGCVSEVATLQRVEVWITDATTGKRLRHMIDVQPGYWIARPRITPPGQPAAEPITPGAPATRTITRRTVRSGPYEFDTPTGG